MQKYRRTAEQRAPPETSKGFPFGMSNIITDTGVDGRIREDIALVKIGAIVDARCLLARPCVINMLVVLSHSGDMNWALAE
ncbi:hypothetical protein PM082_020835 [Marasmius tenuissimus]|nr:hypothetical protein PM082_020835 [Marasmius tenuissimus]